MISFMWNGKVFVRHTGIQTYKVFWSLAIVQLFLLSFLIFRFDKIWAGRVGNRQTADKKLHVYYLQYLFNGFWSRLAI